MRSRALALGLVAIGLFASSPVTTLANQPTQTSDQWSAVEGVSVGEMLIVKMKNGKQSRGQLSTVSDTRLSLSDGNKMIEIERDNVQQIHRLAPKSLAKSTAKATLIGAGIGFGGGAITGMSIGSYEDASTAEVAFVLGGIGAAIGAGIGAMTGFFNSARKDKILIYKSR